MGITAPPGSMPLFFRNLPSAATPLVEGMVVIAAASVNNGTTLMTVANLSKLLVDMQINQVDYRALSQNQIVKLRAESLKDIEMEAKIFFISPVAVAKNSVKGFQVKALIACQIRRR